MYCSNPGGGILEGWIKQSGYYLLYYSLRFVSFPSPLEIKIKITDHKKREMYCSSTQGGRSEYHTD